jgi:ComF family protein
MPWFPSVAKEWWNAGLAFFYPEWCQLCANARAGPAESFVCGSCRKGIRFIERPFCERCGRPYQGAITQSFECANCAGMDLHFSSARSVVYAQGPVLEVIHRYKYHRAFWFEPLLTGWLSERARPVLAETKWDWIVPVPLHSTKQREREFNQAERLARGLSEATRIPVNSGLLKRQVFTESQTLLSRDERQANVRRAFGVNNRQTLKGERVVLIDDVFTTGATANACARALRAAGAGEVCVWTVARGV